MLVEKRFVFLNWLENREFRFHCEWKGRCHLDSHLLILQFQHAQLMGFLYAWQYEVICGVQIVEETALNKWRRCLVPVLVQIIDFIKSKAESSCSPDFKLSQFSL